MITKAVLIVIWHIVQFPRRWAFLRVKHDSISEEL